MRADNKSRDLQARAKIPSIYMYWPVYEILVLMTSMLAVKAQTGLHKQSSLSHCYSNIYTREEDEGSLQNQACDKYPNLMNWLISFHWWVQYNSIHFWYLEDIWYHICKILVHTYNVQACIIIFYKTKPGMQAKSKFFWFCVILYVPVNSFLVMSSLNQY